PVSVRVIGGGRARSDVECPPDDDGPDRVSQRLDRVRDKRLAVSRDPGDELPCPEEEVHHKPDRARSHAALIAVVVDGGAGRGAHGAIRRTVVAFRLERTATRYAGRRANRKHWRGRVSSSRV